MPYDSRTYRVLIASPSDVEEERELAVRVIQEWNDLYSYTRKVVLLPLRWETHTAPEFGVRPQEVINRSIVDNCDLLVGVFWTRIGTPTPVADSGTLEEIQRVAKAGKPVMLYFSKVGMDPDKIDLAQLKRLQDFKSETYPNALTESYKSQVEFRDKFAKQLELRIRELQKADDAGQPPPLSLVFASPDLKTLVPAWEYKAELYEVQDLHEVLSKEAPSDREKLEKEIMREAKSKSQAAILLAIRNVSSSGVRNLFVEMSAQTAQNIEVRIPETWTHLAVWDLGGSRLEKEPTSAGGSLFDFEWDALQPQRARMIATRPSIAAFEDGRVQFTAKVFADSFPAPITLNAELEISVSRKSCTVTDLFPDIQALRRQVSNKLEYPTLTTSWASLGGRS